MRKYFGGLKYILEFFIVMRDCFGKKNVGVFRVDAFIIIFYINLRIVVIRK